MRLDHIAYRTKNRHKTADFFVSAFGYVMDTEFQIEFDDNSKADCLTLTPPEERHWDTKLWKQKFMLADPITEINVDAEYHAPPEIFVSDGPEGSIVGNWVTKRNGVGGIHHIAYQVSDVEATMHSWGQLGYAEFLSDKPLECPGLKQVFTKPSELTGVIYELISRRGQGFCKDNVKNLMESTKEQ